MSLAFALLGRRGGYWGVVQAPELVRSPNDAAVIAAARTVPRGRILDRDGKVLADNKPATPTASCTASTPDPRSARSSGYASPRYGRAGLERAYDAELAGLAGDPLRDAFASSARTRTTRRT